MTGHRSTVEFLASRLEQEHRRLALLWLERLDALLRVERTEVFPSHQLLDHIPALVLEIAQHMRTADSEPIAANTSVMAKASELGLLRFDQRASVHQLLREYQMFGEILDDFCVDEIAKLGEAADAAAALRAMSRVSQAVRVLQQKTVDAFITRYMETIENKTAQLRSFSHLISHEIRQPLGVLQVLSRIINVPEGDEEASSLAQSLERNVVRLAEVATKLERLTRLTRRPEGLPHEDVIDFNRIAADVVDQLQSMADARGVTIEITGSLPSVVTDAGRAELVLVNLLANAIKYSDPAKSSRLVTVHGEMTTTWVRLTIRDNGLGLPESKLRAIFDQFVRVHTQLDDELGVSGMGLGLSIVREAMDAMRGTITVASVEGDGTTFTLEWPVVGGAAKRA
jgi:signal transduction histidine kinase